MRARVALSAVGVSQWIPLDYLQNPFTVSLNVGFIDVVGATYTVQHTLDDLGRRVPILSIIRLAQTVTVIYPQDHGLRLADSVIIENSGINGADGVWPVASVVDARTITYTTVVNANASGNAGASRAVNLTVFPHETLVSLANEDDGNYQFPVTAVRLSVSALASGLVFFQVVQGVR